MKRALVGRRHGVARNLLGLGLPIGWLGFAWGVAYEDFVQDEPEKPVAKPKAEPAKPAPKPKPKPKPRTEERVDTRAVAEPELVSIPGGCFQMGSPESEQDRSSDERQHQACVQDFRIGRYEVTQGEWKSVMGRNPSHFKHCGDRCPVEQYRLPTEAEWEYACRSGGKMELYCGGSNLDALAWYDGNSGQEIHPVGQKAPNGLGLYDMSGNVLEWTCSDNRNVNKCVESHYQSPNDYGRQDRGGDWGTKPIEVRSAQRSRIIYGLPQPGVQGFRLAQGEVD